MENLLSIGQFAKLCHTTIDTLIHYHNMGILNPCHISEKHRRYYAVSQYYHFHTIQLLSNTGMPLNEIKCLMTDTSSTSFSIFLEELIQKKQSELLFLQSAKQYINAFPEWSKSLNNASTLSLSTTPKTPFIYDKRLEGHLFATRVPTMPQSFTELYPYILHHFAFCRENRLYPFPFGFCITKKNPYTRSSSLLLTSPFYPDKMDNRTLICPIGKYAALVYKGSLSHLSASVNSLKEFIFSNQCIIKGDTYITFYQNNNASENTTFLIEIPIQPSSE